VTIRDFGAASVELVAWELFVSPEQIEPAIQQALAKGLVEKAGLDIETGEQLYRLVNRFPDGSVVPSRSA
jgi:hypothetical protein